MRMFNGLLRQKVAVDKNPPVNTTAGESTTLLTQTAGALFGLMPALMSKAASAASASHSPLDGDASAASGHAMPSVGGTALGHGPGVGVPPGATHDVPAAAVNHAPAQLAPHAQPHGDPSLALDPAHGAHAATGSEAPQQLHMPDTSHDIPQPQGPSVAEPATAAHETAVPQMAAGQDATGPMAYADALALHLRAADVGQDVQHALSGALDVSGLVDRTLSDATSHAAALVGEVGASVGSLAHDTHALLTSVAQAPLDAVDRVATPTLAALDQPILNAGAPQAADNVDGAVQNVLSAAGHLSDVGLHGTSTLGSGNDPVGSLSHDASALLTGADSGSPATSSIQSEGSNLGALAHDAIAPLTSAVHAPTSGTGSEPTSLLGTTGGNSGSLDHSAHSDLNSATHSVGTTLGHLSGSGQSGADSASALHASAAPSQAETSSSPAASLSHSASDIGHAASQTSDGVPLHVPLIGQSYADQDASHDAGFSLHVLHGI